MAWLEKFVQLLFLANQDFWPTDAFLVGLIAWLEKFVQPLFLANRDFVQPIALANQDAPKPACFIKKR